MITISDLLNEFSDRLLADTELTAAFVTETGAQPTVIIGEDARNMPGPDDAPCIVVTPGTSRGGQESGEYVYSMSIDWLISDDSVTESGRSKKYGGPLKSDRLGEAIWKSLCAASANIALSDRTYAVATLEQFPLVIGMMDITINVPQLIGAEITL